jgi:YesN/AraC family two-component response regulator
LDDSESSSNTETLVADDAPVILLIEDNIDLCRMLSLQMKCKYNLYIAHDGEDGLKKVYQYHPDVIVSDLMMPGIDGIEVLRRVRHDFSISHIPVIILTAKQGDDVHKHALTTGANAYITKPFSSEILLARIEQLLEEQRIFQRKMAVKTGVSSQEPNEGNNAGTERSHDSEDAYEQHLIKQDLDFVQRIHQIVEENLQDEDFRIDNLASEMGLSRSAFFKKLKSLTGFAPVDYVKEIRLVKAQHLIETTTLNITEVAYAVGFRDAGYFTKCFRQKYGTTPKEYRKREQ